MFLKAFLIGIASLLPIGVQNLYILNKSIEGNRRQAIIIALCLIGFDISMILTSFAGAGYMVTFFGAYSYVLSVAGGMVLISIGIALLKTKEPTIKDDKDVKVASIIATCFVFTWLNPQAIIELTLLMAGFKSVLSQKESLWFVFGFCSASIVWFISLATIGKALSNKLNRGLYRYINMGSGCLMIFFGISLLISI